MLMFTAEQVDVVSEEGVVAYGGQADSGIGPHIYAMADNGAGMSES